MPVTFVCSCGRQLRVFDEMAGRRVRCPACGEIQTAPAVPDLPSATDRSAAVEPLRESVEDGMVRFRCACGKEIQARAVHAGKSVSCPACDAIVQVPEDAEEGAHARIQADRPLESTLPRLSLEEGDEPAARHDDRILHAEGIEEGRAREDRGRQPPVRRKGASWTTATVVLLVLLIGGIVGGWMYYSSQRIAPDLALVPGNAQGFVTIRVADVWKHDFTRKVVAEANRRNAGMPDPAAAAEQALGIALTDVERLTFVSDDLEKDLFWGIVSTYKPYDRTRILGKLGPAEERKQGGKVYHKSKKEEDDLALYFHNERIFLVGTDKGIQRSLTLMEKPRVSGPLDEHLKKASRKHHLVGAMTFPQALAGLKGNLPAAARVFAPLLEFESAGLQLDLGKGDRTTIEMGLSFPDRDRAKKARTALDKGLPSLRLVPQLAELLKSLPGADPGSIDEFLKELSKFKFRQSGSTVYVRLIGPLGNPGQLVDSFLRGMENEANKAAGAAGGPGNPPNLPLPPPPNKRPIPPRKRPG